MTSSHVFFFDCRGWLHIWQTLAIGAAAVPCSFLLWALLERRGRNGWRTIPSTRRHAIPDSPYRRVFSHVYFTKAPRRVRSCSLCVIFSALSSLSAFHFGLGYFNCFNGCSGMDSSGQLAFPLCLGLLPWSAWVLWVSAEALRA